MSSGSYCTWVPGREEDLARVEVIVHTGGNAVCDLGDGWRGCLGNGADDCDRFGISHLVLCPLK